MEEEIRYFSGPGYSLAGVLSIPDARDGSEPHPGVILCQGYAGLKEGLMPQVAERLSSEGYVTLLSTIAVRRRAKGRVIA